MLKKVVSSAMAVALTVSTAVVAPVAAAAEDSGNPVPLKAWYTKAATNWESEATPLGNGFMGAMVFGGVEKDQILINEKTLWSGGPGANPNYDGGHKDAASVKHDTLQQVRELLQQAMTEHSEGTAPYVDENGNVIARNYNVPSKVRDLINGTNGEVGLIGTKQNFGSFQELGSIWLTDPDTAPPLVTRVFTEQDHSTNPNENVQKLFDGNINTKYFADGHAGKPEYVIEWDYSKAFATKSYTITTGNDSQGRDPKNWTLSASVDGDSFETIDTVTDFALPGRQQKATFELDQPGTYRYFKLTVTSLFGTNQAIQMSEIAVLLDEDSVPQDRMVTDYKRELDLREGIARVSYKQGETDMLREYLVNYPDNVMAIRLSASGEGKLTQFINVSSAQSRKEISSAGDTITMTGWPSDHHKPDAAADFDGTLHFAQQIKVIPTGGTMVAQDDGILVENADEIVILMAAGTNYQQSMDESFDYFTGVDPLPAVSERLAAAAEKGFDALYERHVYDYKELFDRVELHLMDATFPSKPTDVLLAEYARTNTPNDDRYLEQLYYQFGRYLLIASSREGSLPANLQGVWASGLNPPWSSDYHANINLQMNYWLAEQTNLSEANIPLMEFIRSLVPRGEISAKHGYVTPDGDEVRGWTAHHEINIWGNTAPATSDAFFSPEDGAWLAQHIWERYQFTMDEQFLRDNYDILLGAALFWVDNLWEDARDGTLVANPSYSPEHGPYSLGATEVQSVIWGIFDEVIRASEVLGIDSEELEEIKSSKSRLAGPKIGLGGQFMEWKDETAMDLTGDNGHRHVNHLFALHPGEQVVAGRSEEDDKFVEAMKVTLNTRGDGGTGWSKAWKINFWARLHDGDRAQKLVKELLYESTLSNLFDTHPPFQIDGNFGATAGMTELLLQSQGGAIQLLPALPSKWHTGSVSGLKARGSIEVDMNWEQSHLTNAVLKTGNTGAITVKGTNMATATVTSGGNTVPFEIMDENTIIIDAQQGATYTISGIQEAGVSHNALETISAIDADQLYGNITKGAAALQDAGAGDYAMFRNVEFGEGVNKLFLEAASNKRTPEELGRIELRLDRPDGELVASVLVDNTGDMNVFKTLTARLTKQITGTHDLYISFTRPSNLRSLQFAMDTNVADVTGIDVLGNTLVSLPESGVAETRYLASLVYSDGSTETGSSEVVWTLGGQYSGAKLGQDGTLTVKEGMGSQLITVTAASVQNPAISKELQVRLVTGVLHSTKLRGIDRNGQSGGSNPQGNMQISDNWVEFVSSNGWLKYNNVDLKDGLEGVTVGYASPSTIPAREIQVRVTEPGQGTAATATKIAAVNIGTPTGGWQELREVSSAETEETTGVKDVYIFWPTGDFNLSYVTLQILEANSGSATYRDIAFDVTPEDATVTVKDTEGYMYSSEADGVSFRLPQGADYVYTVTKDGYMAQTAEFTVEEAGNPIVVELLMDEAAPTWAEGSILTASGIGQSSLTLSWTAAEDHVGVTGYRIYKGSELLATLARDELTYTVTGLSAGTSYTFKVEAGDAAGNWSEDGPAKTVVTTSGGGGTGPVTTPGPTVMPTPSPTSDPNYIKAALPTLDAEGQAATVVDDVTFAQAAAFADDIYVDVPSVDGANGYDVTLPAEAVTAENAERIIEIRTELGTVKIHSAMLQADELQDAKQITLSVRKAGADELSDADQAKVGGKPVLDITLMVDGVVYPWSNPNAPVELFIPYSPSAEERANPEHIVVWFIDDNGMVMPVPSGRYDAELGGVTFTTTHFSKYAVAYVTKTFGDIAKYEWARTAIEVMASKGVINGTSATTFKPDADIKRADFMLLLVKALGLTADDTSESGRFEDVNPDAYYAEALAIAKQHGIAQGVGGNRFNPEASITRQDMMVLIDRAMNAAGKGLAAGSEADIEEFADKEVIASYARQSVATLVKHGIVAGNGSGIHPSGNATRAETAVLIYRIYNK